jgi:hypothetical protein
LAYRSVSAGETPLRIFSQTWENDLPLSTPLIATPIHVEITNQITVGGQHQNSKATIGPTSKKLPPDGDMELAICIGMVAGAIRAEPLNMNDTSQN